MAKKKHQGHYCKVCGEYKSNESFTGKGHKNHIWIAQGVCPPVLQYQLSLLGKIKMPLNVTVKNTDQGGIVINKSGQVIYTDEAPLKVFNDKIYRFNMKSVCLTVKDIKRVDGEWVKGSKMLVAYSDSELYPKLSSSNFINDIEDFVEGDKREENKIKVKGVWYDYYGDVLGSKRR